MNRIVISTPRLQLQTLSPTDAEAMFNYRHDPVIEKYQSFHPASIQDVAEFIRLNTAEFNKEGAWFQFGIFLHDKLIGDMGLHFLGPDNSQCEIGYTICKAQQRKGYGKEAVSHLVDYAFRVLRKKSVIAVLDPENAGSKALLESIGFKQSEVVAGENDLRYSISAEDWTCMGN